MNIFRSFILSVCACVYSCICKSQCLFKRFDFYSKIKAKNTSNRQEDRNRKRDKLKRIPEFYVRNEIPFDFLFSSFLKDKH